MQITIWDDCFDATSRRSWSPSKFGVQIEKAKLAKLLFNDQNRRLPVCFGFIIDSPFDSPLDSDWRISNEDALNDPTEFIALCNFGSHPMLHFGHFYEVQFKPISFKLSTRSHAFNILQKKIRGCKKLRKKWRIVRANRYMSRHSRFVVSNYEFGQESIGAQRLSMLEIPTSLVQIN